MLGVIPRRVEPKGTPFLGNGQPENLCLRHLKGDHQALGVPIEAQGSLSLHVTDLAGVLWQKQITGKMCFGLNTRGQDSSWASGKATTPYFKGLKGYKIAIKIETMWLKRRETHDMCCRIK